MNSLFQGKANFNSDISNWNTTSVTDMANMFQNAKAFNKPLSNFNTAKVMNMGNMFAGALLLIKIFLIGSLIR